MRVFYSITALNSPLSYSVVQQEKKKEKKNCLFTTMVPNRIQKCSLVIFWKIYF